MSVQANQPVKKEKKGGGGLGGLLGAAAGLGATVLTGGAAAPVTMGAMLGGAATGAQVGGMIGGALAPGQAASQGQGVESGGDNPMLRRLQSGEQQAKIAQLREAAMATAELPPEQRAEYLNPIMTAAAQLSPLRKQGA